MSHSWPMRLMQQNHHHRAKLSELPFFFFSPVKVLLLMRTKHVIAASGGQGWGSWVWRAAPCKSRRIPTSISLTVYNVPKNSTRGSMVRSHSARQAGRVPACNAIRMHPEPTGHCLPTFQSSHVTRRSELNSREGGLPQSSEQSSSCWRYLGNAASNFPHTNYLQK